MLASRRRRGEFAAGPGGYAAMPPGWAPTSSEESIDLAKQLVRLTDVVVQLVTAHREETHRDEQDIVDSRARARSPGADLGVPERVAAAQPDPAPLELVTPSLFEPEALQSARAGPAPPAAVPVAEPAHVQDDTTRSSAPDVGDAGRPGASGAGRWAGHRTGCRRGGRRGGRARDRSARRARTRTRARTTTHARTGARTGTRSAGGAHGAIVGARSRASAATRMDGRRRLGCLHRTAARAAADR